MTRFLVAASLAFMWSCARDPGPTGPTSPAPTALAPALSLSGTVVQKGTKVPLSGIQLKAVFSPSVVTLLATTDGSGVYSISPVPPDATSVSVVAGGGNGSAGAVASTGLRSGDTRLDFELSIRGLYTLSGVVTEATVNGVVPIAGVLIEAWVCGEVPNCRDYLDLTATTDSNGRYAIPGLWAGLETGLWVTKAGYVVDGPRPSQPCDLCDRLFTVSVDTQVDISLKRR